MIVASIFEQLSAEFILRCRQACTFSETKINYFYIISRVKIMKFWSNFARVEVWPKHWQKLGLEIDFFQKVPREGLRKHNVKK